MNRSLPLAASRPLQLMLATLLLAAAASVALPALAQPAPDQPDPHAMLEAMSDMGPDAGDHMRGDGPGGPGRHGPGGPMGHGPRGPMGGFAGLSGRALDAVKATPEQRSQIRQIMEAAHKDLAGQRDARRALHAEAQKLFAQPTIDAAAVESLRQKRLSLHDQASKRMTQAMLDASRVLTADQRKQLADLGQRRQQMMERHRQERDALEGVKR